MATNWVIVSGSDIRKVLSILVEGQANQNTLSDTGASTALSLDEQNRRDELVRMAVAELRAAVRTSGRVPLSVTPLAVPPESEVHVLTCAAYRLVLSTPNLQMFVMTDKGLSSPFTDAWKAAQAHYSAVRTSKDERDNVFTVTPPTDPTGEDYLTAVDNVDTSATYNPAIRAVRWGDESGTDIEYMAGEAVDPTTGAVTSLPVDMTV